MLNQPDADAIRSLMQALVTDSENLAHARESGLEKDIQIAEDMLTLTKIKAEKLINDLTIKRVDVTEKKL